MTPLESAILREMARPVVDNRTERGCCGGCGECCGRVLPLSVFDVARLKAYVERNGIEPSPGSWIDGDGLTVNMMCPFLDEGRMCKVYEARPEICRVCRCDLHKAGLVEAPYRIGSMRVVDMRDVFGWADCAF